MKHYLYKITNTIMEMSKNRIGNKHPMFGRKQSDKSKENMSLHKKGILRWVNNGTIQKMIDISNGIPEGFCLGRGWYKNETHS